MLILSGFDVHVVANDLTNTELSYNPGTRPKFAGKSLQAQVNRISSVLPDYPYLSQIDQIHEVPDNQIGLNCEILFIMC